MTYTLDQIKNTLKSKGYHYFDNNQPYNLNIIGIRSKDTLLVNQFNDQLYLIYKNEGLSQFVEIFPITTKPGLYWLKKFDNPKGCAILVPNQYLGCWKLGLHLGQYEALVQCKPVKVYRDNDKDDQFDLEPSTIDEGVFGINIHRSNPFTQSYIVDMWSAGCQVFQKFADYEHFLYICKKQSDLYGNNFSYTLLNENEIL
jgi:hypothetical protein